MSHGATLNVALEILALFFWETNSYLDSACNTTSYLLQYPCSHPYLHTLIKRKLYTDAFLIALLSISALCCPSRSFRALSNTRFTHTKINTQYLVLSLLKQIHNKVNQSTSSSVFLSLKVCCLYLIAIITIILFYLSI